MLLSQIIQTLKPEKFSLLLGADEEQVVWRDSLAGYQSFMQDLGNVPALGMDEPRGSKKAVFFLCSGWHRKHLRLRLYVKGQSLRSWSPVWPWSDCCYFYSRKMKLWCSEPEHPVKMPYDCVAHWPFEGGKKKKEWTNTHTKKSENYWNMKTDSPKCFSLNYWDSLKDILIVIILNMHKGEVVFSFQFPLGKHKTLNFCINWVCVGSCVCACTCVYR